MCKLREDDRFRITRPEVDIMREEYEQIFRNKVEAHDDSATAYQQAEARNGWTPPSPR